MNNNREGALDADMESSSLMMSSISNSLSVIVFTFNSFSSSEENLFSLKILSRTISLSVLWEEELEVLFTRLDQENPRERAYTLIILKKNFAILNPSIIQ
jgi:hypothetical protein